MKYISLFSGIEAATVAWKPLGWKAVAFAEIEPAPCAVLAHHYPGVPNLGDVSKITGDRLRALGKVDLVVGGFPCQDLSVAGNRAGFGGERSSLFFEMVRIVDELRPSFLLWENVPGLLSSRDGRDFAKVLLSLDRIGFSGAWTCLDAQWFGLAQRRRRIFGLFTREHLGAKGCAEILSFQNRLCGNPAPSREAGARVAGAITNRVDRGGVNSEGHDQHLIPTASTGDISHCLNAGGMGRIDYESETLVTAVAFNWQGGGTQTNLGYDPDSRITGAIQAKQTPAIAGTAVRRLLPVETERLQGFPDNYTAVPHRGKPLADGSRYKALGNSFAVPVVRWIGERIEKVRAASPQPNDHGGAQ